MRPHPAKTLALPKFERRPASESIAALLIVAL
jgi:hypothetical protein